MADTDAQTEHAASPGAASTDVVIVGAGPTGLMAAALLARCGVSCRILDKSETAAHESRAFGVQAKSLELFLNMGLDQAVLDKGLIATGVQVYVDGKQAAEANFDDIGPADTPYSYILMVPQSDIEAILAEDVARHGISIERGVEVTGFEQSAIGVTVHAKTKSGETFDVGAAYVIGADGAHSVMRHKLGLSFDGAPYPQGFLLADCKIEWPFDYDHVKVFLHGRNMAVYLPLRGKDTCRVIAIDPIKTDLHAPVEQQGSSELHFEEIQEAFAEASGLDVKLSDPTWTSRYHVHHRAVNRYRQGRVFVAGDAAHIHSPAGGQGMNTGLQDAANLAWKLALRIKGHARDKLLDTYHEERWPVGQNVLKTTDRMFSNMTVQSDLASKLRNFFVPIVFTILTKSRWFRARAFHFLSQLAIHYEPNDFLLDRFADAKPSGATNAATGAGRRAPGASIGKDLSIFDLIKDYRFHVVALSRKSLNREEIESIGDQLASLPKSVGIPLETHLIAHSLIGRDPRLHRAESSEVFDTYGVTHAQPQALFLIRPDGYIAFRADSFDIAGLQDFLASRFGAISA
jgi:2-polyprenyl-6-methoxyphenol hydroxylase-like FAD-dependent oxidoreductase